jgi:hypothetical protein
MTLKANELEDLAVTRKKVKDNLAPALIFNGQDLTHLLSADSKSLDEFDKSSLRQCYNAYGRPYIEKFVYDSKIVPFAAHVFVTIDCDKEFWKEKHDFFVKRNDKIKVLLNSVFIKSKECEIASLTLTENFAVVLSSDSCMGCFCSGDVDLSADINEIDSIIACLNSLNFFSKKQPAKIGEYSGQSMMFHNKDIIKDGFWINVIWKPVTRAFLDQDKYETRLFRDRLEAKLIRGTEIRVLDDTSLMYFCALHIAAGHYYTLSPGIRLYVDIDRLARSKKIEWDEIIKWSEEDNAGVRISMVMCISNSVLKTPIPKKVYDNIFFNRRYRVLLNYLMNSKSYVLQNKSSSARRLFVEIASDKGNLKFFYGVVKKIIHRLI